MHHAYYIEGPISQFEAYRAELKPFWDKNFERFGIDETRKLIELASLKNFGKAVFFVAAASLTTEAQQALLKLFEEPQEGTTFILLVPHGTLIPTLRSRMLRYPGADVRLRKSYGTYEVQNMARKFLKGSQKERSAYIATLLKDDEGVKERVRGLLNELELELHTNLKKTKQNKAFLEGLQDVARVRNYVGDRSPALKMLLEHLALALPKV